MDTFDWTQFAQKVAIKAEMQDIYNAWAKPNDIEKWFLETANYKNTKDQDVAKDQLVQAGDTYIWTWYLYDGNGTGEIKAANGTDHIQFTFADSIVEINLSQLDDHVIVDLTQKDIPTDNASKRGIRLGCHTGWSFFMIALKSFYENGIDLRNKDKRFSGSVN
ncbi:MAG: hypothetical protein ACI837_000371 [Crocinitomicaceae bacterium]|jgi:uncharacterized protein YndB with AHSA1/START domain